MAATFAVASDYSEVIETPDGFGRFPSKLAAVEHWIDLLEREREAISKRLSRAKRMRRRIVAASSREKLS